MRAFGSLQPCMLIGLVQRVASAHVDLQASAVCQPLGGTNVYVSNCVADDCANITAALSGSLPPLPESPVSIIRFPAAPCRYDGVIVWGGVLSIGYNNAHYAISMEVANALQMVVDFINELLGGLVLKGRRYAIRLQLYSDDSSLSQVTRALAYASRANGGADFLFGPFGSSLTKYAVMQSEAEGKILLSATASTPAVIASGNLTFGMLPPAVAEIRSFANALNTTAAACDQFPDYPADMSNVSQTACSMFRAERCGTGKGACVDRLKAAFIYEDSTFTREMCSEGPLWYNSHGIALADDKTNPGTPLMRMIGSSTQLTGADQYPLDPYEESLLRYIDSVKDVLREFMEAGVTVVVGCTYFASARALIEALDQLNYAPLAVQTSAALTDPTFQELLDKGWWKGEYVLEATAWHPAAPGPAGEFSYIDSTSFTLEYKKRFGDRNPGYAAAAAYAAGATLGYAIQKAQTSNTTAVASVLRDIDDYSSSKQGLEEFYATIKFDDETGQVDATMFMLQYHSDKDPRFMHGRPDMGTHSEASVVFHKRLNGTGVAFPMPSWEYRRCVAAQACLGICTQTGECILDSCASTDCNALNNGTASLTELIVAITVSGTFVLVVACALVAYRDRRNKLKQMTFRDAATGLPPTVELVAQQKFLLFLSHVWRTGQDQVAVIKRRLVTMLPGVRIFLDVEDLADISKLEEHIQETAVVLIFLSRGYFLSKNCLREVRAAVEMKKPIVLVRETNPERGGDTLENLIESCPEDLREGVFGSKVAPREIILWMRVETLQLKSLQLIAQTSLRTLPKYAHKTHALELVMPKSVDTYRWTLGEQRLLHFSPHNPGAMQLADEIIAFVKSPKLTLPSDSNRAAWAEFVSSSTRSAESAQNPKAPGRKLHRGNTKNILESQNFGKLRRGSSASTMTTAVSGFKWDHPTHFLLYLNSATFVGEEGDRLAAELRVALTLDPPPTLLMVHERDDVDAGACDFERFFHVTPVDLIHEHGIFKEMAVARYPGAHKTISMCEICRAMGMKKAENLFVARAHALADDVTKGAVAATKRVKKGSIAPAQSPAPAPACDGVAATPQPAAPSEAELPPSSNKLALPPIMGSPRTEAESRAGLGLQTENRAPSSTGTSTSTE